MRLSRDAVLAVLAVLVVLIVVADPGRAESPPIWLTEAVARPDSGREPFHGAVVVERETRVTVSETAKMVVRERGVLRTVTREGAEHARATAHYRTDGGRVREFRAWVVSPAGVIRSLPGALVVDMAYRGNFYDYDEVRARSVAAGDLEAGSHFAWDWTIEQTEPIAQIDHAFQDELGTSVSRIAVELPAGWDVTTNWVGQARVAPRVEGSTRTWQLEGLAEMQDEPLRPPVQALAPRLEITIVPPPGRSGALPTFSTWAGVSGWLEGLARGAGEADPAVHAEAARLLAGARTELDSLRALGRHVQSMRYVSIQLGVSRGGGYRPHPAGVVLRRAYGDCKDKANLLRSLLAAAGRPAHLLVVHHGDADYVRAEWPSPAPFNHCIVAIPLRRSLGLRSEVDHPRFGRLLVFDPTDSDTPMGDLSTGTQAGLGLIVAAGSDAPFRMPALPPEASLVTRNIEIRLESSGDATGTVLERARGQSGATERRVKSSYDERAYRDQIVRWLRGAMSGAELDSLAIQDDAVAGVFETRVTFRARGIARRVQDRMLVIRPPVLSRLGWSMASDRPRRHPADVGARAVAETLVVRIPDGWAVDELPGPEVIEGPLARFEARTDVRPDALVQGRSLVLERGQVPLARVEDLRTFFGRVRGAEDAPVVLVRR